MSRMSLIHATCAARADVFWERFAFLVRLCHAKFEVGLVTTHMSRCAFRAVLDEAGICAVSWGNGALEDMTGSVFALI